jgi:hypothetical protein
MAEITEKTPWHREPFVWLLIAIPLTAVIVGFVGLGLAISTDDGLVEDDYYRQGKQINRVLVRDRAATARGLESTVELDAARQELRIRLTAHAPATLPDQIELKFLHATRGGLDRIFIAPRHANGIYRTPLPVLAPGRWNLQLAAQDWRLVGSLSVPGESTLRIRAAAP